MANHTIDCQYCGKDIRTMGVSSMNAHENNCPEKPDLTMTNAIAEVDSQEPPTVDELVGEYVAKRDRLGVIRKNWKRIEAKMKAEMAVIEVDILELSRTLGVNSFKTNHGTAFKVDKDFARVAGPEGWELLCKHMVETNDFGLVEKRVAKLHFKEVMESGTAPQDIGVEYVIEEAIQVRRS